MDSMSIAGTGSNLFGPGEPPGQPYGSVRLPAEDLPPLFLGEQLNVRVLDVEGDRALIVLKGVKVAIARLPGLEAGTELFVRVTSLSPRPVLEINTRDALTGHFPSLNVGQELVVHVLEQLPEGHMLLGVQGTRLEAAAPTTLAIGTRLPVVVEQLRPQVVLRVLDPGSAVQAEAAELLRAHLPYRVPAGVALGTLQQALHRFSAHMTSEVSPTLVRVQSFLAAVVPPNVPPTPERLATLVRDGGMHYEAKLARHVREGQRAITRAADADLKGLLLRTVRELDTAESPPPTEGPRSRSTGGADRSGREAGPGRVEREPATNLAARAAAPTDTRRLANALVEYVQHIETQQAVNVLARVHGEAFQLQIPIPVGQGWATALLALEPDERSEPGQPGRERGYNLLFHLDLEDFGTTRIDAHVSPRALRAVFYTEKAAALALLRAEIPAFRATLQAQGFEDVLLAAEPLERLTRLKVQKFAALHAGVPGQVRLIDVRA